MALLKQSTARNRAILMVQSSDHISGATGLTLTIAASKDGAAFGSITPTVTELANGWYSLALTTSHTGTLGDLALHITSSGADPTDIVDQVVALLPGDAVALQTDQAVNVTKVNGTAQTARDIGASVLLSPGTGTGQLSITSGVVSANTTELAGQAVTAAAGVTFPSSVASPTNITAGTIATVTNLTNAATSGDLTATMKASVTTAATAATPTAAAVTGAVGSVTGAVGSVTGNVGGSVIGTTGDATNISSIKAKTDNLPASPADESLIIAATNGILTRLGSPAGASVSADVAAVKTDTLAAAAAAIKLDSMLEDAGHSPGEARFTVEALVNAPAGAGGSAPTVAQIWDEAIASHLTAGSMGKALSDAGAGGNPWNNTAEGAVTFGDLLRGVAAEAFGTTGIQPLGNGQAIATFNTVSDPSTPIIVGQVTGSQRTSVTFTP